MSVSANRWKHFGAMMLIGDGVMALVRPQRDAAAWAQGPKWWCSLMEQLRSHPELTRAIGAAQIVGGVWWAICQERQESLRGVRGE